MTHFIPENEIWQNIYIENTDHITYNFADKLPKQLASKGFSFLNIYLIRHAQSENNLLNMSKKLTVNEYNHILRHAHEAPLTKEGERQAQAIGEQLRHMHIGRLYSSPYSRALATAEMIGQMLELPIQIRDDLYEVHPLLLKESQRRAPLYQHFINSYVRMLWPWRLEEPWTKHYRRAQSVWAWIEAESAQNIILVSHAWFICLLLMTIPRHHQWHVLQRDLSNCGITLLSNNRNRSR